MLENGNPGILTHALKCEVSIFDMIKKIISILERHEDEPLEFDKRYSKKSEERIKRINKSYSSEEVLKEWLTENKKVIEEQKNKKNRASLMAYFDEIFTTDKIIRELKEEKEKGVKIIGTVCNMVPEELIYAAGGIPIRLCSGHHSSVKPGEEFYPRDSCPLIKSFIGSTVAGNPLFEMCDVIIVPTTCDGKKKIGELLNDYKPVWTMELPHNKESIFSKKYWLSQNRILKKRLENLTKKKINRRKLQNAIKLLQMRQDVAKRLLNIQKSDMPVISGIDYYITIQSAFFDTAERWTRKTKELCEELESNLKSEKYIKSNTASRFLFTGAPAIMPNLKIPLLIESLDANITVDETCSGSQYFYDPVVVEEWTVSQMMKAISERYLMPSVCPCFVKSEDRIDKLLDMIKEYKIDGVIYHTLRLCVLFDIESKKIKDIMEEKNIPFIYLNTDYSKEDQEQLRTRIEAFNEIVSSRKQDG